MKKQSPEIFPIFMSGYPCVHGCAYCNAKGSSGVSETLHLASLKQDIIEWVNEHRKRVRSKEVALYGNDLLSLESDTLGKLTVFCRELLSEGLVDCLRTSLRPDSILTLQPEQLNLFSTIEIGVPTMDRKVLDRINRGHTPDLVRPAMAKLRNLGIDVGLQTMIGLPGATLESDLKTAKFLAAYQPDFVRIHPTLVLKDTPLEIAFNAGEYCPMDLKTAVDRTVCVFQVYNELGINVARCGFHLPEYVRDTVLVAGPWHPAFGQLVKSRIHRNRFYQYLRLNPDISIVEVALNDLSDALGQKRSNVKWLSEKLGRQISIVGE